MKATAAHEVREFRDIPNVGKRIAGDLILLGIKTPKELQKKDPLSLYKKLCLITDTRQDPCVLDTFMAIIDFMNGAQAKPWFAYTKKRKELYTKEL